MLSRTNCSAKQSYLVATGSSNSVCGCLGQHENGRPTAPRYFSSSGAAPCIGQITACSCASKRAKLRRVAGRVVRQGVIQFVSLMTDPSKNLQADSHTQLLRATRADQLNSSSVDSRKIHTATASSVWKGFVQMEEHLFHPQVISRVKVVVKAMRSCYCSSVRPVLVGAEIRKPPAQL